jgi:RNA polymerase sigma-70 factor (ECF subfamily)
VADGSVVSDVEELITQQIPKLRRYARALIGDPVRADDLVQEALLRGLSRRHLWKPGTDMRAWMFTILHNLHVNNQRRRFVRGEFQEPLDDQPEQAIPSTQEMTLEIRDLAKALHALPEAQREVVLLVGLEGMDYKQVAGVLEVPVGTVMSRLHRGREALRRLLAYGPAVRPSDRHAKLRVVP